LSDHLKIAVVKPLYKNGNKTTVTNYRPISLLTVFYKVLKKPKHRRLCQHLHTNNRLVAEQCGFRKGISTEDAALRPTDSEFKSINQKMHVGGMLCDLAKVCKCMNHEILLAKLHFYGIRGVFENWFRAYLTNRRQKVEVKIT